MSSVPYLQKFHLLVCGGQIPPDAGQTMLFTHAYPLHGIWRSKLKIIWSKLLLDFCKRLYLLDQAKLGIKRKPIDERFKFYQVMMTMAGKKIIEEW